MTVQAITYAAFRTSVEQLAECLAVDVGSTLAYALPTAKPESVDGRSAMIGV
jgi:hypothetical protein